MGPSISKEAVTGPVVRNLPPDMDGRVASRFPPRFPLENLQGRDTAPVSVGGTRVSLEIALLAVL